MFTNIRNLAVCAGLLLSASAEPVWAQSAPGGRAAGMAGAFVAVADDASAVYWNPAGIGTGALISAVVDYGRSRPESGRQQLSPNQWDTTAMVGISATALGVAYYRHVAYGSATAEPAVAASPSREEVRRNVQASTVGVSLVQSLTDHLIVGATPKFVRGGSTNRVDLDAGLMWSIEKFRVGMVARNLTTPSFTHDGLDVVLDREVRVGAAWGSGWTGMSRVIVSVDSDLTSRMTVSGDRRDIAAGVETWWLSQRLGVRGGVRRSTIGDARAAVAAGVSAGLSAGALLEAHVVRGHAEQRSWGIGARVFF
ncbi:MAG: hypothetical protein RLZZ53_2170 [Acidobacteriota bacterium]|jgi:hypothetical protein